jgi:hypothetical protein
MVLRISGMLLSHFKRNWDAILPHLKPCILVYVLYIFSVHYLQNCVFFELKEV